MEHIRQALDRVAEAEPNGVGSRSSKEDASRSPSNRGPAATRIDGTQPATIELRHKQLEAERIVAHDITDPRSKSFDMLRTQILQSMDLKEWQVLAVTSPTPGCGKTFTSINLAMSIARQREKSVLLIDMDLQKPQIASRLGIRPAHGLVSMLEGKASLAEATARVRISNTQFSVLPCERSVTQSSDWMASSAMATFLRSLRQNDRSQIIILDLPPVLTGDDVLLVLPHIDCVLFVAAAGLSTASEFRECNKHLQSTAVVRIALNKSSAASSPHYY